MEHMHKKQLFLPCKGHGGWRPNAGRPTGSRVTHHGRDVLDARHPVHLVWRTLPDVPSLRRNVLYPRVVAAIRRVCEREDFRIVHACVLGNHLHLIAECDSAEELGRAMLSLGTSIAMRVNRITGHRGAVFQDRYFVRQLRTPTEVARAVTYVVGNEKHHGFELRAPLPLAQPMTWLLREGWKRVRTSAGDAAGIDLGRPRADEGSRPDDARAGVAVP
jgi:REP element-mobilizing transposase RayT